MRGWLALAAIGCAGTGGTGAEDVLPAATDAEAAAAALTGGEAGEAEATVEDGLDLWEVDVEMPNGAELEVLLQRASGELFEIEDQVGPFDYALDPLPGQLTYAEARDRAWGVVEGEQRGWEVKLDGDRYFYEFYVSDSGSQLWEVKLWADDGEVFVTTPKDDMD